VSQIRPSRASLHGPRFVEKTVATTHYVAYRIAVPHAAGVDSRRPLDDIS